MSRLLPFGRRLPPITPARWVVRTRAGGGQIKSGQRPADESSADERWRSGVDRLTGVADIGELVAVEAFLDARSRTPGAPAHYGIALVSITALRDINRTLGSDVGDAVLLELADRLRTFGPELCVARVDGDAFAILVDGIEPDELSQFARVIRRKVNRDPFVIGRREVPVHVRVTFRSGPSAHARTDILWAVQRAARIEAGFDVAGRLRALEEVADLDGLLANQADLRTRLALAEQRARQDPLTGAFNRRGYEELLPSISGSHALAFVDVDNLRELNKAQGENWAAGDLALRRVTRQFEAIDPNVVVVRWGGDEFLLLLPGRSAIEAHALLQGLLTDPNKGVRAGDRPVTFSGGVDHAASAADHERAKAAAQVKTQAAKAAGRSQILV